MKKYHSILALVMAMCILMSSVPLPDYANESADLPVISTSSEEEPVLPFSEILTVNSNIIITDYDVNYGGCRYSDIVDYTVDGCQYTGSIYSAVYDAYGVWADSISFCVGQDASNPWQEGHWYDTEFTVDMPDGYNDFIIPVRAYLLTADEGNVFRSIDVSIDTTVIVSEDDMYDAGGSPSYRYEYKRFDATVYGTKYFGIDFYDLAYCIEKELGGDVYLCGSYAGVVSYNIYTEDYYNDELGGYVSGSNYTEIPFDSYIMKSVSDPLDADEFGISIDTLLIKEESDWDYYSDFENCAFDATVNGKKFSGITASGLCDELEQYIGFCRFRFTDYGSQDSGVWKKGCTYSAAFEFLSDGGSRYDETVGGYVTSNVCIAVPFKVYIAPWDDARRELSFSVDTAVGVDFSQADWNGNHFVFNPQYITIAAGSRITATVDGQTYENISFPELEDALRARYGRQAELYCNAYFSDGGVWKTGETHNGQIYISVYDVPIYDDKLGGYVTASFSDDLSVTFYVSDVTEDTENAVTVDSDFYISNRDMWTAYELRNVLFNAIEYGYKDYFLNGSEISSADLHTVLSYIGEDLSVIPWCYELMTPFGDEEDEVAVTEGTRMDLVFRIYYFDETQTVFNKKANAWVKATRYIEVPLSFLFGTERVSLEISKTVLGFSDTLDAEVTFTFSDDPVSDVEFYVTVEKYDENYDMWNTEYWNYAETDENGKISFGIPMKELGFDGGDCVIIVRYAENYSVAAEREFTYTGFTGEKSRYISDFGGIALFSQDELIDNDGWYLASDDALRSRLKLVYTTLDDDEDVNYDHRSGYYYDEFLVATVEEFEKLFDTKLNIEAQTQKNGLSDACRAVVLKVTFTIDGVDFEYDIFLINVITSGKAGDTAVWNFDTATATINISGSGEFYKTDVFILLEILGVFENNDAMEEYINDIGEDIILALGLRVVIREGITGFGFSEEKLRAEIGDWMDEYGIDSFTFLNPFFIGRYYEFPSTFTEIPDLAFTRNTFVQSVVIPEGVTKIGAFAFYAAPYISEVTIPVSVTEIDVTSLATYEKLTVNYKGTEEQWKSVKMTTDEAAYKLFMGDDYDDSMLGELREYFEKMLAETLTVMYGSSVPSSLTSVLAVVGKSKISGIPLGTTVEKLINSFAEKKYVRIYRNGVEQNADDAIGTGMNICIVDNGNVIKTYTAIVIGDTNGDGDISITDMLSVKSDILKKSALDGDYATAGDTNNDGVISITDFLQIKAQILKKGNILQRTVAE